MDMEIDIIAMVLRQKNKKIDVPLEINIGVGNNWDEAH